MSGQEEKLLPREVKLEELMEVITSYKCRFCSFTSTTTTDMTNHLQKTHITTSVSPKPPPAGLATDGEGTPHISEPESEASVLVDPEGAMPMSCIGDEGGGEGATVYETSSFLSTLGLTPSQGFRSPRSLVSPAIPDPKVLTSQMRSVAKNLPVVASSQSDFRLFSLTSSSGTESVPVAGLQLTGSGLTLTTTATSMDSIAVPLVDSTKDLGTGPTSIAPITRELFLCGVCSMGFISVDECKSHMERVHNTPVEASSVSDTVIDKYEQRISIGTQATGKRPGRKRKSEMPPPSSSPPSRKFRIEDDENDEDWIPGRSLSSGGRDGTQRRRIRAPKALKEDYVTDKKRRYRKRQMVMKESFSLECSYMGCPTKFRCQEALDIHHECHNKADDAFTCVHCQMPFQVWKPLRIHLYRHHSVDCDMYQCDLCEYKTDTLHKLGVHREIHSDNRPYTCDVCGKGFKQLSQMKNHQIIHVEHQRSGRETWFSNKTCEVCKRTFANSKCLRKHVEAVHGQNKPFQCQHCNHTCSWKAMLILHERTHTGEKPFKCDVCPYATGDHNSLRRHKMRHTGQRQYKCQLCSYTCIQTISLKTHMRNKHPHAEGVVYTCQLCKFRTINKQIYDNHTEDHRNGLIPDSKLEPAPPNQAPMTITIEDVKSVSPSEAIEFQLQVKRMETGELHANKEDIDKLNTIPQLVHSGMDANQLIYSALNIGSHMEGMTYTAQLLNGVQSTVSPSLQPAKGVLSSYSITFQAPEVLTSQPSSSGQVVYQLQSLEDQGVVLAEATSESSEPSSQGVGQDDESVLALDLSQGPGVEQVAEILYSDESQVMQPVPKDTADGFSVQNTTIQVLDVTRKESSPEVCEEANLVENFVSAPGAVVVSQAGVDGVLLTEDGQRIMVMEGGQVVHGLMEGERVIEGGQVVGQIVEAEEETSLEVAGVGKDDSVEKGDMQVVDEVICDVEEGGQVVETVLENQEVVKGKQVMEKVLVIASSDAQEGADSASCKTAEQTEGDSQKGDNGFMENQLSAP